MSATHRTPKQASADIRVIRLQVILKTVERCNLACPYCYYFYGGDKSFEDRPARIKRSTVDDLVPFLQNAVAEQGIRDLQIVFHGGEPMLQRPADFDHAASILREALGEGTKLSFSMQTNGTRFSDEWIALLDKHGVSLGLSIDGRREEHDRNRFDHSGRGSYDKIVAGLKRIQAHPTFGSDRNIGTISVLNGDTDYRDAVNHLVDDLAIKQLSFLLPDCNHVDGIPNGVASAKYGEKLAHIFDIWAERRDFDVREIGTFMTYFQRTKTTEDSVQDYENWSAGAQTVIRTAILVVQSDGTLAIDDSYIPTGAFRGLTRQMDVLSDTLSDFLADPAVASLRAAAHTLPTSCGSCVWAKLCGGGDLENRLGPDGSFDNPSIFCEALQAFYLKGATYLVENGYPRDELMARLDGEQLAPMAPTTALSVI